MLGLKSFSIKIRHALLFLFFIAITIFSTVILIEKYLHSKKLAFKATQDGFAHYAKRIEERIKLKDKLNQNILIPLAEIKGLAVMPEIGSGIDNLHFNIFMKVIENNKNIDALHMGDANGNFYLLLNFKPHDKTDLDFNGVRPKWLVVRVYNNKKNKNKENKYHYFLDENLKTIGKTKTKTTFDSTVRNWYIMATSNEGVIKTPPYSHASFKSEGITYAKKIDDTDSVLGVNYNLISVSETLKDDSMDARISAIVLNENKDLIANFNVSEQDILFEKKVDLSQSEIEYLTKLDTVVISNEMDWPPFDYAISGVPKGYSVDMMELLAKKVDMTISFVNGYSWQEIINLYNDGKIDLVHSIISKSYTTDDNYKSQISYELVTPKLIVRKNSRFKSLQQIEENQLSIANVTGYQYSYDFISEKYPGIKIIDAKNPRDAFQKIENNIVAAAIEIDKVFDYISNSYHMTNLEKVDIKNTTISQDILNGLNFVSKQETLIKIFDKAYNSLTENEREYLNKKWFSPQGTDFSIHNSNTIPSDEILEIARKSSNKVNVIKINNEKHYIFTSKFNSIAGNQYLAILTKESDVIAPYMKEITRSFILTIALFLLLLPIVWLVSGVIVKPILALKRENEKIQARDYEKVKEIKTPVKELHTLSVSLVDMSNEIHNHANEQEKLLNSFIQLIADAIDEKSVYTGGHCSRVPILTFMIVSAAIKSNKPAFKDFDLKTKEEIRELAIAAWLHDCGKITTPEHVVDKAVKLETIYNRIHEIRTRFEVIHRDLQIQALTKIQNNQSSDKVTVWLKQQHDILQQDFDFIAKCNIGSESMSDKDIHRISEISKKQWVRHFDDSIGLSREERNRYTNIKQQPYNENLLSNKSQHIIKRDIDRTAEYKKHNIKVTVPKNLNNLGEIYNLSIKKGTLTEEERFIINSHMIVTIKMLDKLPFPKGLQKVPEYAGGHHETLIGTGYPKKLYKDQMSIPARVMAVADVFEALTAADRPYKDAKTLSESLSIMRDMVNEQHIDGDIFKLFLESGIVMKYSKKHLKPEQIDKVNIYDFLRA